MTRNQKFFVCKHCGNVVGLIEDKGVPVYCCGEPMHELEANTSEGAAEKHLPVVRLQDRQVHVNVGSAAHPMQNEHHIAWVYLETDCGGQRKSLKPESKPEVIFALAPEEKPAAVFAYCNLHGLWKTEVK